MFGVIEPTFGPSRSRSGGSTHGECELSPRASACMDSSSARYSRTCSGRPHLSYSSMSIRVRSSRWAMLLTPTVTVLAPPYGGIADPVAQQRIDELTVPADLAGSAAISLPAGALRERPTRREPDPPLLPAAVQLIADRFQDAELFAAALDLERLLAEEEG